jgi:ribosomal subunit interface protein
VSKPVEEESMEILQITFRGISSSPAIDEYVRRRAAKLETFYDRVIGCRIAVEAPSLHHHEGKEYRVRIDLTVPGAELVVTRAPDDNLSHQDVYAAIDDAFDDAGRMLQDFVDSHLRKVKTTREAPRRGRVSKLFHDQGYGFLETTEGDELYFHRNSVLAHGFDRLKIGSEVRFAEEDGDKGPQASTVIVRQ